MNVCITNWEDEENSRQIELSVEYRFDDDRLELVSVTPLSLTFLNPDANIDRKVKIHTQTARRILSKAYHTAGVSMQLEEELNCAV